MASFTNKGTIEKVSSKSVKRASDFLDKENPDYEAAALKFFADVLNIDNADTLQAAVKQYLETCKRTGKDGTQYADIGGRPTGYTRRAFGAVYGSGDFGGLCYTIAGWYDTQARQEALKAIVATLPGTMPTGKKGKGKK